MKRIILITAVLFSRLLVAQNNEISNKYDKIGNFVKGVAFVHKDGLVGMINTEGKELVKPEYERIDNFGKDSITYTWKKDLVGLIDIHGKVLVDNIYEHIGHFKANQAIVRKGNLCGVIDRTGKIVIEMKYDKLVCEENGIVKAVNPDGTEVLLRPNK